MRQKVMSTTFLLISTALFFFLFLHLHLHLRLSPFVAHSPSSPDYVSRDLPLFRDSAVLKYSVVAEAEPNCARGATSSSVAADKTDGAVGILFPDWEVFVVADPSSAGPGDELHCVFRNNAISPARFAGALPFSNRTTFLCLLPPGIRRRPFYQPLLTRSPSSAYPANPHHPPRELLRWDSLAYESLSTADDVVLFVKGLNKRQGVNRSPSELNCVFFAGDDPSSGLRTAVTSSAHEVFRCAHPDLPPAAGGALGQEEHRIKISLEIPREERFVPSVAYYAPHRASVPRASTSLTCASTMVYNVAKFLREWVIYHSRIGVERFVLYDNGSDDDLAGAVEELNRDGYDVRTIRWPWPKSQEAGFSHSAIYHNSSCTWMMYMDVDEFLYVPSWSGRKQPSSQLIESSVLPQPRSQEIGQVSISCHEFGPSGRKSHPPGGVIEGYTCRRRLEQRHKSFVRLDAVDPSLLNAIHHFKLRQGYRTERLGLERAAVNHYKYQAWPEFRNKFRRRVSTYVTDWTQPVNPASKDRTPGLGFEPIEPKDWPSMFCEVTDEGLKLLASKWFGKRTESGRRMPW